MFAEDLSVFFSREEHAVAVKLTTYGSTQAKDALAIYAGAHAGDGMVAGVAPTITLPTAAVPCCWEDCAVRVLEGEGAGCYVARGHKPDGTGVSLLVLEKA